MTTRKKAGKSSPARIDHRARAADAVRLRTEGLGYREIAAQLGFSSENAANKAVLALINRTETEAVGALRDLESLRLDHLWRTTIRGIEQSEKAEQGVSAPLISAAVRISERRARLLGLDTAARVDLHAETVDLEGAMREFHEIFEIRSRTDSMMILTSEETQP